MAKTEIPDLGAWELARVLGRWPDRLGGRDIPELGLISEPARRRDPHVGAEHDYR